MKKSKGSSSGDRLSELPDSLIFHIFWYLPIRDAVRTTKLSKRWRKVWTIAPFLNLSHNSSEYDREDSLNRAREFINRALLLWKGAKLLKFKLSFQRNLTQSLIGDINVWMRFAKEKEVEELYLDLWYPPPSANLNAEFESSSLMAILYSCSSLRVLSISSCSFLVGGNGNVKWDRLESLRIDEWKWDQDAIAKVLCGSPKLEEFMLSHVGRGLNYCIHSSSLKKLSIFFDYFYSVADLKVPELKIRTPNLETLEISGIPYRKLSLDVGCLTDVTLGFYCMEGCDNCSKRSEYLTGEDNLKHILPSIQHVQSLTVSECCVKVLGLMNKKCPLSPLSKVKFLKLIGSCHMPSFSKHEEIVGLLQIFPNLKRLVIQDNYDYEYDNEDTYQDEDVDTYQDDREPLEFEANLPYSFLLQLRTVEVTWGDSDKSMLLFIETLLKYASKLEKMVIRARRFQPPSPPSYPLFLVLQKLLRMPRSSPTAQLIFCKY